MRISASFHHDSRRDKPSSDITRETTTNISFKPTSRRSSHHRTGHGPSARRRTPGRAPQGICPGDTGFRHPQVRDLPRQPRRLQRIGLPHRPAHRHLPRRPRHRLRPLPQRPNRLDLTPDKLTGKTTKLPGLSEEGKWAGSTVSYSATSARRSTWLRSAETGKQMTSSVPAASKPARYCLTVSASFAALATTCCA